MTEQTTTNVRPEQRTSKKNPCPICGGYDSATRGRGERCYGFTSEDGEWARCTREEHAGQAPFDDKCGAFIHKLSGKCECGVQHGFAPVTSRSGHPRSSEGKSGRIVETYAYTDERGEVLYETVRFEPKAFRQRRRGPDGNLIWNLTGVRLVLYRLPELLAANREDLTLVCAGEKDANTAADKLGFLATTNPLGEGKWKPEYSEQLRGRPVAIMPHNDEAGRKHAEAVARSLYGKAASVKIVNLPGVPEDGGDLTDWADAGGTAEDLEHLIGEASEWSEESGSNPLLAGLVDIADIIENGIEPPEELEPGILLKGRVHHVFAPAAVGKTYLALWLAKRRLERGQKVLYLDAENGQRIISERLEQMGVSTQDIRDNLNYLPFPTLDMTQRALEDYAALIEAVEPVLVIFDSWIKFLSSAGLEEDSNDDVAMWAARFLQPIRNAGITSLVLDHVPHDGTRSRGASRKRDEVDVQFGLTKTQHFNRATTGEIRLKLEKDRDGWLPEFTTFSIGGGENGFVFSRSSGTIDGPGSIVLKTMERVALDALVDNFGDSGARHNEWLKTCVPKNMSKTSFGRARDELIRVHLVRREEDPVGPKYYPKLDPTGSTGNGPDFFPLLREIPDRVQQGPNRVHGPDGNRQGPQGPHPLRGGPVDPDHEPGSNNDELIERVEQALEHGNGPKKALEHFRNGDQDLDSLTRSVMFFYARGRDDPERWRPAVLAVLEERGEVGRL